MKFVFFLNLFFLLNFFLQQHENIIKSNNKKNNYINQLLRLPLVKYTHREKNNTYDKKTNKKKSSANVPPQEKSISTTPQTEVSVATVKE